MHGSIGGRWPSGPPMVRWKPSTRRETRGTEPTRPTGRRVTSGLPHQVTQVKPSELRWGPVCRWPPETAQWRPTGASTKLPVTPARSPRESSRTKQRSSSTSRRCWRPLVACGRMASPIFLIPVPTAGCRRTRDPASTREPRSMWLRQGSAVPARGASWWIASIGLKAGGFEAVEVGIQVSP